MRLETPPIKSNTNDSTSRDLILTPSHDTPTGPRALRQRAVIKPPIPSKEMALVIHKGNKERDFQTLHEELTHLRGNVKDLEKIITTLKAEDVRLRQELIIKGKECSNYREEVEQLRVAKERDSSSYTDGRVEWGRVISDRDSSIERLQRHLSEARDTINELLLTNEVSSKKSKLDLQEAMYNIDNRDTVIRQLEANKALADSDSKERARQQDSIIACNKDIIDGLRGEIKALTTRNDDMCSRLDGWDLLVAELKGLRERLAVYMDKERANISNTSDLEVARRDITDLKARNEKLVMDNESLQFQVKLANSPKLGNTECTTVHKCSVSISSGDHNNYTNITSIKEQLRAAEKRKDEAERHLDIERQARRALESEQTNNNIISQSEINKLKKELDTLKANTNIIPPSSDQEDGGNEYYISNSRSGKRNAISMAVSAGGSSLITDHILDTHKKEIEGLKGNIANIKRDNAKLFAEYHNISQRAKIAEDKVVELNDINRELHEEVIYLNKSLQSSKRREKEIPFDTRIYL